MNTLNFLDANVWLALFWARHVHSEKARQWFEQAGGEQFFFCRFTQLTVLRLLTTEAIMGKDVKTMSEAWSLWDQVWVDHRISFLPEPDGLEEIFACDHGDRAGRRRYGPMHIFWRLLPSQD